MNNNYLIPANSKKSMMIFGMFYPFDLLLFGSGIVTTFILITALPIQSMLFAVLAIMPALVTGFLVFPLPNYHNVLSFIISVWEFYTTRQRYVWKGWCVHDEIENKK